MQGGEFWREQHFWQDGHPLQNFRLKKGSRAVLKPGRQVPRPYRFPSTPSTPKQTSAQGLLGEIPCLRQGGRLSKHIWPVLSGPRAFSKAGHRSLHSMSMLPGYHMKDGRGRANANVQHLREATETDKEPSLEREGLAG